MSAPTDTSERTRIIEAAYRCLSESNGTGVSVNGILGAAGLSTRAFYRHFDSKDALMLAMFRSDSERVHAELTALADAAPTPREALQRWIEGFLTLTVDARRRRRVLVMSSEELLRTSGYAVERARVTVGHRSALAGILERGRAVGSLPWADPEPDARIIMAALSEVFQDLMIADAHADVAPDPLSAQAAAVQVTAFAFRALGGSPS